jgi:hypothetical protein
MYIRIFLWNFLGGKIVCAVIGIWYTGGMTLLQMCRPSIQLDRLPVESSSNIFLICFEYNITQFYYLKYLKSKIILRHFLVGKGWEDNHKRHRRIDIRGEKPHFLYIHDIWNSLVKGTHRNKKTGPWNWNEILWVKISSSNEGFLM